MMRRTRRTRAFNRTFMELKLCLYCMIGDVVNPFNRTFMELKRGKRAHGSYHDADF